MQTPDNTPRYRFDHKVTGGLDINPAVINSQAPHTFSPVLRFRMRANGTFVLEALRRLEYRDETSGGIQEVWEEVALWRDAVIPEPEQPGFRKPGPEDLTGTGKKI